MTHPKPCFVPPPPGVPFDHAAPSSPAGSTNPSSDWSTFATLTEASDPISEGSDRASLSSSPLPESNPCTDLHRFDADLDLAEVDERHRPGPAWSARGQALSRSRLIVRTRRMCYPGRRLLVAVHLIDHRPVLLFGSVSTCEYDRDGLYCLDLELAPVPNSPDIATWLTRLPPRRAR